jgi:hypothetical protein
MTREVKKLRRKSSGFHGSHKKWVVEGGTSYERYGATADSYGIYADVGINGPVRRIAARKWRYCAPQVDGKRVSTAETQGT